MIRPTVTTLVILTAAASVFALAGCASQQPMYAHQGAELDSMYAENRELSQRLSVLRDSLQFYDDIDSGQYYRDRRVLEQEIDRLEYELAVCADGGRTLQTLQVDELFEPASANLTDQGRARLFELADTLSSLPADHLLRVEGYADTTPIGSSLQEQYPSNWELSAARAAAVVRQLIEAHGISSDRFQVVSFGSTQPVETNATAAGRSANRRIRIAAVPR